MHAISMQIYCVSDWKWKAYGAICSGRIESARDIGALDSSQSRTRICYHRNVNRKTWVSSRCTERSKETNFHIFFFLLVDEKMDRIPCKASDRQDYWRWISLGRQPRRYEELLVPEFVSQTSTNCGDQLNIL